MSDPAATLVDMAGVAETAERWALVPAEDGGVEIAPLGPDGLPAGPVRREADLAAAVRDRPGCHAMGVAVDRRGLSAAARRGRASRAVLRHRGRRDAPARPRGPARRAPVRGGGPRPGCAAVPYRPIRRSAPPSPARSPPSSNRGRCTYRWRMLLRGVRRPAATARRDRAPGADAAADGRRVGGHAGGRRDERGGAAVARRRPPRAARTNCSASGTRAVASRAGSPSWRTRCRRRSGAGCGPICPPMSSRPSRRPGSR